MNVSARNYWRSLEELAESPGFAAIVETRGAALPRHIRRLDRRRFLQLMAASMALGGLSGCGPETNPRQLLPYVDQPPGIVPGRARYYATATTHEGYATGVMVAHQMARPIKVEGNPDHPASLGAASAIMQASILGLYDPRRAQTIVGHGRNRHLGELCRRDVRAPRRAVAPRGGDGLAAADRHRHLAVADGADSRRCDSNSPRCAGTNGSRSIATTSSPPRAQPSAGRSTASSISTPRT